MPARIISILATMSLDAFHPAVSTWFRERFGKPTEAQAQGWDAIGRGQDSLIMAPTGSGKTLAAFLAGIDALVRRALDGRLDDKVRIIYVSPRKALGADVERNLRTPLREIENVAARLGRMIPPIRTAVRSGDTTPAERQKMLKRPPHVLITTPESLYLLLTSQRGRTILTDAETLIVDEIHALAGNKRGAHLSLTLERLDALLGRRVRRIGLSATVEPPAEAARFLVGCEEFFGKSQARPCQIVDAGRVQPLDLQVEVPKETLSAVASRTAWTDIYQRIAQLLSEHKTTLIFVPSRRLSERVAHDLEEIMGKGVVAAHHGALAKKTRLSVESRLQAGEIKAVVATASLELGIDVGAVELVIQIGSPRSISVMRQRIGRASHSVGGVPKGRIFALTRDELLECGAGVRAMRMGMIDKAIVRVAPLDILAQQLVAMCSADDIETEQLYLLTRRAAPYADITRREFGDVLRMLSDGIATRRGRSGAHLHHDRVNRIVRGRRGARLAALTSGGAIPDKADYQVVEDPSGAVVGSLDEDFAIESMVGDIFLLGSTSWRVRRVENGRVRVENAHGAPPSIPFWNGEGLARSYELSGQVSRLREEISAHLATDGRAACIEWLLTDCALDRSGAEQALQYVQEGEAALGCIPTIEQIVAERFFDDAGGMQLVVHAPFGARINRAWGLALRKKFCRTFDFELQAAATDEAVLLSLGPQHSFPLETIFNFVQIEGLEDTILQAILPLPMWETRWRWNSMRSLAVLRHSQGRRTPPPLLRMRAADLAAAVFPAQVGCQDNHGGGDIELPDHPLVNETARDCLYEAMDTEGFKAVLTRIASGAIRTVARDTVSASPWAHAILNANPYSFLDDAPLEERRSRAVSTHRPGEMGASDLVTLDSHAIEEVVAEAAPQVRDEEELHDLLLTHGFVGARPEWQEFFETLRGMRRVTSFGERWVCAERVGMVQAIFPEVTLDLPPFEDAAPAREDSVRLLVGAHMLVSGPVYATAVATALGLESSDVEIALAQLEGDGQLLQGQFLGPDLSWCERGLLQRIHRRTIGARRAQIERSFEPVPPSELIRFLLRWQHLHPGSRQHGAQGVKRVIEQLEGVELQPAAWERDVLPARIENYDPRWLDELCFSGEVAWARLRVTPPESSEADEIERRRSRGSSGAIGIFLRADAEWLIDPFANTEEPTPNWVSLTPLARRVAARLAERGAAFVAELSRGLAEPAGSIEDALWELVRTGAACSDGFAGLRALIAPRSQTPSPQSTSTGRWSLLHRDTAPRGSHDGPFHDGSPVELAKLYLRRYGVVMRDLLRRESAAPPWRDLLAVYRRLEARGEIRGGRFVQGLTGEQFALPEAIESLRALRLPRALEEVVVAATDPLNLVGLITPGPRVPAMAGHSVIYRDGVPVSATRALA